MKALNLNLKNMKQRYHDTRADENVWNAFYTMYLTGFISRETWVKFFDECKDWTYDEEKHEVIKMFTNDIVKI